MDRRVIGVLMLLAAVISAVAVPNIPGHRVAGTAIAVSVPPAPEVGACVTLISSLPPIDVDTDEDVQVGYPTARYGSCAGTIVGEVMSVNPMANPLNEATVGSYQQDRSACELSEVNYVGSIGPFDPATIDTPGIAWQADVGIDSISVGPSALQRAAGQNWTACVGTSQNRTGYRGRIAGALTDGVLPPVFATCWRSLVRPADQGSDALQVPCTKPHPIEIIALTQITDADTTRAQVDRSCLGMASRALRTSDPTRGGALNIAAYSLDGPTAKPPKSLAPNDFLGCIASVADPRRLTGTLIGIGEKPLPVTG